MYQWFKCMILDELNLQNLTITNFTHFVGNTWVSLMDLPWKVLNAYDFLNFNKLPFRYDFTWLIFHLLLFSFYMLIRYSHKFICFIKVDTNVARIAVRLGWVTLEPLPFKAHLYQLVYHPKRNNHCIHRIDTFWFLFSSIAYVISLFRLLIYILVNFNCNLINFNCNVTFELH